MPSTMLSVENIGMMENCPSIQRDYGEVNQQLYYIVLRAESTGASGI